MWDIAGGSDKTSKLTKAYYKDSNVVMYVIDSSDRDTFEESLKLLEDLSKEEDLKNTSFLIFANKQDKNDCYKVNDIKTYIKDLNIKQSYYVCGCVATTGEGLYQGLDWICKQIEK